MQLGLEARLLGLGTVSILVSDGAAMQRSPIAARLNGVSSFNPHHWRSTDVTKGMVTMRILLTCFGPHP